MGAWGSGGFENDAALDWADSVESLSDVRRPFEQLSALVEAAKAGTAIFVDADLASAVIAAAETVAMLMGRGVPNFPEDLRSKLADAGEPDNALYHEARTAVSRVLRNSELAELWEETAEESGTNDWHVAITGLIDRLNPELEFTPWPSEDIEKVAGGPVTPCAFCGQTIPPENLFGMQIHDYSDIKRFTRGLFFHLPCLNARLHHSHAIVDLKFDPNNMPDAGKL